MSSKNIDIETHSDVVILVGAASRVIFDLDDEDMLVQAYNPTDRLKECLRVVRRNGGRLFVGVSKMDDVPYFLKKQDVDVFAYKSANEVEYWGSKTRMAANRENGLDPILTISVDDSEDETESVFDEVDVEEKLDETPGREEAEEMANRNRDEGINSLSEFARLRRRSANLGEVLERTDDTEPSFAEFFGLSQEEADAARQAAEKFAAGEFEDDDEVVDVKIEHFLNGTPVRDGQLTVTDDDGEVIDLVRLRGDTVTCLSGLDPSEEYTLELMTPNGVSYSESFEPRSDGRTVNFELQFSDDEEEDERPTLTGGFSEVLERADEAVEDLEDGNLAGEEDWREAFDSESEESREEADIDEMLESGPTDERLSELMEAVESEDGEVILVDSGRSGVSKTLEAVRAIRAQEEDEDDDGPEEVEPKYDEGDLVLTPEEYDKSDPQTYIRDGFKIVGWYESGDTIVYQLSYIPEDQNDGEIFESDIEEKDSIEVVEEGGYIRNYKKNREEDLTTVSGVGLVEEARLRREGYTTVEDLQAATQSDLASVDGIGTALSARVKADVGDVDEDDPEEVPEYIDEIDLTSELEESIERAANGECASAEEVEKVFEDVESKEESFKNWFPIDALEEFEELTPGLQEDIIEFVEKYDLDRTEAERVVDIALIALYTGE